MKGYSKMQMIDSPPSTKSRSIDFSDLHSSPIPIKTSKFTPKSKASNITATTNSDSQFDEYDNHNEQQQEENKNFPGATSSITDTRINREKKSSSKLQTTVKKAFSMRRSSSISEKYCRIHDDSLNLETEYEDEEDLQVRVSTNKKGSVLKACKRIFRI